MAHISLRHNGTEVPAGMPLPQQSSLQAEHMQNKSLHALMYKHSMPTTACLCLKPSQLTQLLQLRLSVSMSSARFTNAAVAVIHRFKEQ